MVSTTNFAVKNARDLQGIAQWRLCQMTGISQSTISVIEKGYRKPSNEHKKLIAKALKKKVEDLFPEKD